MPLDLARLAAGVAPLAIPYGDEVLHLTYRPERVTGRTFGVLARAGAPGQVDLEALYAELARLIATWDLTDGGEPVPTDAASLAGLGLGLVGTILSAILADAAQNPTRAPAGATRASGATSNGSSATGAWAPAPTGSASSPPDAGPLFIPASSPDSPGPGTPFAGVPG